MRPTLAEGNRHTRHRYMMTHGFNYGIDGGDTYLLGILSDYLYFRRIRRSRVDVPYDNTRHVLSCCCRVAQQHWGLLRLVLFVQEGVAETAIRTKHGCAGIQGL